MNFTLNLRFPVLYREDVPQRKKKQKQKNITFVCIQNVRAPPESSHEKISKALIRFHLIISGVNATGKNFLENFPPPAFASLRRREIQPEKFMTSTDV